ncbi:MAG: glutamine--fructose-6-phosphate transaminase (isomerizing) [Nitrospinota bacterium]
MCGISGIVSSKNVSGNLLQSIQNLEYRGYDSCGMALINARGTIIRKNVGYVADVAEKESFLSQKGKIGIAHTRWATHGKVTRLNAHPHASCDGNIVVVHNGIISNYEAVKKKLAKKGHKFTSETDSEVIAHQIEELRNSGLPLESAFVSAMRILEGSYAVAMVSPEEPKRIFCAKHESPLIIGLGETENYIGSDFNAFIDYTKNSVVLDDGEYALVSREGYAVKKIADASPVAKKITVIEWDAEMAKKGGFPHYMLKEIHEQPQAIERALAIRKNSIVELAQNIVESKNPLLTGVGTTYYVAQVGQYSLASQAGVRAHAVSSDEFTESVPLGSDDFVLAISQSGETYDTMNVMREAKKRKSRTMAIVNVVGSSMARIVDTAVMQGSGPEICVLSTKAAMAQMVILMRVALEAGQMTEKLNAATKRRRLEELNALPGLITGFINERSGFVNQLAQKHARHYNWLFLGRGIYYPIAQEAALKVKEVAYLHVEGMSAGFLKHGTIALIDEKLRTLVFMPHEKEKALFEATMSSVQEIKARGGYVVGFHSSKKLEKSKLLDDALFLPSHSPFVAPLMNLVAAQLFAYFIATALDRNVDKPRALAKSVTVA